MTPASTTKRFGYIRVSSKEQNIDRQILNMEKEGITDERDRFIDKVSGKSFDRPQYQLLKQMVRPGDTIVFDSITRMGRNMSDTVKEYDWFVENGINLEFIKEPIINTNNTTDDIMKQAIQRIILTILTAFAEKEREEIKTRQAEGIAVAKMQGKHLGRPKTEINDLFIQAYTEWQKGNITAVQAMKKSDLKKSTFYKLVGDYEKQLKK